MAIQISEHKLSPQAKKALNNSKNKSQFLRDAIEFYVKRDQQTDLNSSSDPEMKEDIKEIKDMLLQLSSKSINFESAVDKDTNIEINENIVEKTDKKINEEVIEKIDEKIIIDGEEDEEYDPETMKCYGL
ncbi:MAG: hypothetical protein N4A54_03885 [Peptostreptococcaceae bacterium]|nr:hypothetical protein [Peptostreptococcaceae bacterium]